MPNTDDLARLGSQISDTQINPLADVLTRLIARLADKGILTKEEAIHTVADSIKLITDLPYSHEVREQGAEQLMRMVQAIDQAVEPGRSIINQPRR